MCFSSALDNTQKITGTCCFFLRKSSFYQLNETSRLLYFILNIYVGMDCKLRENKSFLTNNAIVVEEW